MDKYESLKLKNQLCFPIYLCAKEIIRKYTPFLAKIDLTYTQYVVMMYFWENKESNVKELGKALVLDPSTLTPLLKKLESKGYVIRQRSEKDERNLIIKLNEKGDKIKEEALSIPSSIGKCIDLSEDETKNLYSLIYKVLLNVERN